MATLSKWVPIGTPVINIPVDWDHRRFTTIDIVGGIYCHICYTTFGNKKEFDSHYVIHNTGGANIVYTCVICRKQIVGYPSFRGHCYLAHVTKNKFKCEHCQKLFSKSCVLQSHIKAVHSSHCCLTCQKEFLTQKDLFKHRIGHKNEECGPPFQCQTCSQQIESVDDCEHHIEDHCFMLYNCPICNEDIVDIHKAASHLTKHFGDVLIEPSYTDMHNMEISNESSIDLLGGIFCIYCEDIFKGRPEFDIHFMADHGDKDIVYACNICGKEYEKYFLFANHCYNHSTKNRFECEECLKPFSRLSLLVIHMESYHSGKKQNGKSLLFNCLKCDHGFKTDRRLSAHYRTVHGIYYSQCPENGCGKTFGTPKDLIYHLKEHKSAHSNWCRQCGLEFCSLSACERHIQVHKKKNYSCPICNKQYGEKYLVMKHISQHFTTVFHVCNVCGKIYNNRNRLVQHMKVHNEERAHKCKFCGKGFTKTYLLQQHLNIHTGLKPYKCSACEKTFASYPNMRKHMKKIHNIHQIDIKLQTVNIVPQNVDKTLEIKKIKEESSVDEMFQTTNLNNNNIQMNEEADSLFGSTMAMENTVYHFQEPCKTETKWQSDMIDPVVLEMLEDNLDSLDTPVNSINEIEQALWVPSPTIDSDTSMHGFLSCAEFGPAVPAPAPPPGPAPACLALGDDHLLPHIDPRLTLRADRRPPTPSLAAAPCWEPFIAKVYPDQFEYDVDDRLTILNTNIF